MRRHPRSWYVTNMVTAAAGCIVGRRVLGRLLPRLLPKLPRVIVEDLVKHNFLSSTTSLWKVLYEPNLAVDADAIPDRIPVRLIHGSEDASAPIETVRALAIGRPSWRLTELQGSRPSALAERTRHLRGPPRRSRRRRDEAMTVPARVGNSAVGAGIVAEALHNGIAATVEPAQVG